MLDIKWIENHPEDFKAALKKRNANIDVNALFELNASRKSLQKEFDALKAEQNEQSKQIGLMKREKKDTSELMEAMQGVSKKLKELSAKQSQAEEDLKDLLSHIPNVPAEEVPEGADENDNKVVREWGQKPTLDFEPKEHFELGEALGMLDFEKAANIAGSRFSVLMGKLAKLERVLAQFMLDVHTEENGYTEVIPPYIVNDRALFGTGQLPKFKEDLFNMQQHHPDQPQFSLIPTAEVPVTNLFQGDILEHADLPKKFCAFTPCFRSEAGSYGKDMKGLIRQHQFHKVELVKITSPEESDAELEALTADAEKILQKLM